MLISPEWQSRKGMNVALPLKDQRTFGRLSALFVVGRQEPSRFRDAKRIHGAMEKAHTVNPEASLPFYAADTSLQGLRLIYAQGLDIPRAIALFIDQQLVQRADQFPWTDRTSPLRPSGVFRGRHSLPTTRIVPRERHQWGQLFDEPLCVDCRPGPHWNVRNDDLRRSAAVPDPTTRLGSPLVVRPCGSHLRDTAAQVT